MLCQSVSLVYWPGHGRGSAQQEQPGERGALARTTGVLDGVAGREAEARDLGLLVDAGDLWLLTRVADQRHTVHKQRSHRRLGRALRLVCRRCRSS
jgi:hypothetical protein